MKTLVGMVALVCGAGLLTTLALAQAVGWRAHENAHHVLLMLEQREVIEHAKALHQYAHDDGVVEQDVVARHVEEIAKNLDGIDAQITEIQEIDGDGKRFDMSVAEMRNHNAIARENLMELKAVAGQATLDPCEIGSRSAVICDQLRQSLAHHRKSMAAHHVPALLEPTVDG